MRLHYLQHVWFEDLGVIRDWAEGNKFKVTRTALYENQQLPEVEDFDCLVIMGGPMGVYQEGKYAWLHKEKEFIKKSIAADKKVLGICLGAQLIADVLGAKVYPNRNKEIGWFPINLTQEQQNIFDKFPKELIVFHWHGDTFDLPKNSLHLAESQICKNQAFSYNDNRVLALQFHLELKEEGINRLVEQCQEELVTASFIQTRQQIQDKISYLSGCNEIAFKLLNTFFIP